MFKRITMASVRLVERWLPDPYVLVLILTLITFVAGMLIGNTPMQMIDHWGTGFWGLLQFSMQMVLILVTGWVLASTVFFRRILEAVSRLTRTPGQAIIGVTLVGLIASWINWGFGLVIGAMAARQIARQAPEVDYRLLIASAYSGFLVWHGGLAGSVPLTIATEGHFLADKMGLIPTSETIFSFYNLAIVVALFIIVPLVNWLMMPDREHTVTVDPAKLVDELEVPRPEKETPADKLENSLLLSVAIGVMGVIFAAYYFISKSGGLNLNIVNFIFLMLGILLHGSPARLLKAVETAARGASGIIIQFPFYAGIMGMMLHSGLAQVISDWFVAISTADTLPLFTFWAAGLVNIFVPSGGGQWAVQGPIMIQAAQELGADLAKVAMAVAWGDAWTNMIQPFWALPALAIAGLRAKDIMGYCLIILVVSGIVVSLGFVLL